MTNVLKTLTTPQLLSYQSDLLSTLVTAEKAMKELQQELHRRFAETLQAKYDATNKDCGTVAVNMDGVKVKSSISKSVSWDQDILRGLYDTAAPVNVQAKYTLSEKDYKELPEGQALRARVDEARTVKLGVPKVTLEAVK